MYFAQLLYLAAEGEYAGKKEYRRMQHSEFAIHYCRKYPVETEMLILQEKSGRLAIISCCGKTKCSKAFSNSPVRKTSFIQIERNNKSTKIVKTVGTKKASENKCTMGQILKQRFETGDKNQ